MARDQTVVQSLVRYLLDSEMLFSVQLDAAGRIRTCNAGALRVLQMFSAEVEGKLLADFMTAADAALFRQRLKGGVTANDEPLLLNVVDAGSAPVSLRCHLFADATGLFFIGERLVGSEESLVAELMQINNQMTVLTREMSRKSRVLARRTAELEERNQQLEAANRTIERLVRQDALTGLANRRHFDEKLAMEAERGKRQGSPVTIIMLDLDHFKAANDRYGHAIGDAILAAVGAFLQEAVRPYDFVARLGGEEFVLPLPGAELANGTAIAERLRHEMAKLTLAGYPEQITASYGVALLAPGAAPEEALSQADAALYRAKAAGRNRVECAREQAS